MKNLDLVREAVEQARREQAPAVDVAAGVMAILASLPARDPQAATRSFAWVAGISAALAAPAALVLVLVWDALTDPLVELVAGLAWDLL